MSDRSLDENETRLKLVNPALALAGWSPSQIAEEVATGRVGSEGKREPGRADYVLHVRGDRGMLPVAVLEVKSESREPDEGVEQATAYARALSGRTRSRPTVASLCRWIWLRALSPAVVHWLSSPVRTTCG